MLQTNETESDTSLTEIEDLDIPMNSPILADDTEMTETSVVEMDVTNTIDAYNEEVHNIGPYNVENLHTSEPPQQLDATSKEEQ